MTEQPPSAEAIRIVLDIRDKLTASGLDKMDAREIDALCEKRLSAAVLAEQTRCARIANDAGRKYRDMDAFIADEIYHAVTTGIPIIADSSLPPGTAEMRSGNRVVRITNLDSSVPSALASTGEQPDEYEWARTQVKKVVRRYLENQDCGCPEMIEELARILTPEFTAVVDYTERARLFANQTYTGPDSYARYRKALSDEFSAVASERQAAHTQELADVRAGWRREHENWAAELNEPKAALLARLREPDMREAVAGATWNKKTSLPWNQARPLMRDRELVCADAALAVITETLT